MVTIPLRTHSGLLRAEALVDDADADWLNQWRWCLLDSHRRYVVRTERRDGRLRSFAMHRVLLGLKQGDPRLGDHVDRNPLNNRRANLRILAVGESPQNVSSRVGSSSRFRGVSWHKRYGRWAASVRLAGKLHNLGLHDSEEEAAAVAAAFRAEHMPFAMG